MQLVGYAHSTTDAANTGPCYKGKYGVIAAFKSNATTDDVQKKILQHIVGLNPQKVGDQEKDEPNASKDDEVCLIYQEFLLDPEVQVGEVLEENGLQVLDFQRFQCGEAQPTSNENVN